MAEPLTQFQEPGFFSQIREQPSLFLLPGSIRTVGLIGTGKDTKSIVEENLTRDDAGDTETLANTPASITRVFSEDVLQYPASSYGTSITATAAQSADVNTLTLKVKVNDVEQTFLFDAAAASAAATAAALNTGTGLAGAAAVGFVAVDESGVLKLLSGTTTVGDGGAKIEVTDGDANASLFFVDNSFAADLDWTAQIAETTDNEVRPQDGEDYLIDYETPKTAADLKPKTLFGISQVVNEYGDVEAANTLSTGAQAAFAGGASVLICRQLDPAVDLGDVAATKAEHKLALTDMELESVNILVPMLPINTYSISVDIMNHVSKMSQKRQRKERTAILATDEKAARIPVTGGTSWTSIMSSFAATGGQEPKRIQVVNPGRTLITVRAAQIELDGTYSAAVLAGLRVSPAFDEATSMTRKGLPSIDELILPEISRTEKNSLTVLGVTVLEAKGAQVVCRRSVTADSSSIASQEPSIVDAFDKVAREMREALENRFTGTKIIPGSTKVAVEAATNRFLQRFVDEEIIGAFRPAKANQNATEPRQFDIEFEAVPIFPFLWGSLDISITIS